MRDVIPSKWGEHKTFINSQGNKYPSIVEEWETICICTETVSVSRAGLANVTETETGLANVTETENEYSRGFWR